MTAPEEQPTLRIILDRDRCTGLGLCEAAAPDFFEVQDDGSLILLRHDASEECRAVLNEAVLSCPTEALRIEG